MSIRRKIGLVAALAVPAVILRATGIELGPEMTVAVFGAAVVASAFLLAWAAEAAQVDISGGLAIALLALIAVLPEYAVDLYFAYTAGHRPEYAQFAAANMTGSNRLLIGIGWPPSLRRPLSSSWPRCSPSASEATTPSGRCSPRR